MTTRTEIGERFLEFAAACLRFSTRLRQKASARYFADQMMRSSASAGANYQEACGAESRLDFQHKLQLVLKELRETEYWLKLVERGGVVSAEAVGGLKVEADELIRITVSSIKTSKRRSS